MQQALPKNVFILQNHIWIKTSVQLKLVLTAETKTSVQAHVFVRNIIIIGLYFSILKSRMNSHSASDILTNHPSTYRIITPYLKKYKYYFFNIRYHIK